jgi:hypothetical protein
MLRKTLLVLFALAVAQTGAAPAFSGRSKVTELKANDDAFEKALFAANAATVVLLYTAPLTHAVKPVYEKLAQAMVESTVSSAQFAFTPHATTRRARTTFFFASTFS